MVLIGSFLEYVPGGTIATIYRTPDLGRFEEQIIKFFTKQILEGLAYLHGKHIWHRVCACFSHVDSQLPGSLLVYIVGMNDADVAGSERR
jgi:serine/threonine protein kinase